MNERVRQLARRARDEVRLHVGRWRGRPVVTPPVGRVDFGDLRRTRPIGERFGYDRGGPIDRRYIEQFLERHQLDIAGRVLEVGDDGYIRRYGGDRVTRFDVLHVDPDAPGVTILGDVADTSTLPAGAFDCIVFTQTLQYVYDFESALHNLRGSLAPNGVLLLTVPAISHVDLDDRSYAWNYSFARHAVERMTANCFDGCSTSIESRGNVLTVIGFLHGLGVTELTEAELDDHQMEFSLIHTLRVVNGDR